MQSFRKCCGQTSQTVFSLSSYWIADCQPGTHVHIVNDVVTCPPCPKGQYQPERSKPQCLKCQSGSTTVTTGSIKEQQCVCKFTFFLVQLSGWSGEKMPLIENVQMCRLTSFWACTKSCLGLCCTLYILPVSILRKSISGRHRPVRVADGPMMARCRFM